MKLPQLTAKQVAKALARLGFVLKRQKGSHMSFQNPDGKTTTVPSHPGEKLDKGLLNKIIKRDIKITREEFLKAL